MIHVHNFDNTGPLGGRQQAWAIWAQELKLTTIPFQTTTSILTFKVVVLISFVMTIRIRMTKNQILI